MAYDDADEPRYEPIDENTALWLYTSFKTRYAEWDTRKDTIVETVMGRNSAEGPDGKALEPEHVNLIQVALEDVAEQAGTLPTVRVTPYRGGVKVKEQAAKQQLIGQGYVEYSRGEELIPRTIMDVAAHGLGAWIVWPDFDERMPLIELRDARECYPDPDLRQDGSLKRCMFSREVRFMSLPQRYQDQLIDFVPNQTIGMEQAKVIIAEFFTCDEVVIVALFRSTTGSFTGTNSGDYKTPVVLERWEHGLDSCPVVVGARYTLDRQYRGQFDQVIGPLKAYARLMALVLDYADQAVYSDIWVKDLIGELSWGGGAYVELGPNGGIGRVPPAVTSLNIQQDIDRVRESIHVGSRWPQQRIGQVDQSIASAKFVESTVAMLNTALRTYHILVKGMLERSLRVCYRLDQKYFPGPKMMEGIYDNQEFVEPYDPSKDIDLRNRVRVEYGLGLGRDPSQSAVLMLQYMGAGIVSKEFVQENVEGIADVDRERRRIDSATFTDMMKAHLLQATQSGQIPPDALVQMAQARENGEDMVTIFQKFVVQPQQQQPFSGVPGASTPGAVGPPGAAGGPPGMPPAGPPGATGPGVTPPPAPDPVQMLSRLSSPLPGRTGFLSTQTGG